MSDVIARAAPGFQPRVAVVLGSGLGGFAPEAGEGIDSALHLVGAPSFIIVRPAL